MKFFRNLLGAIIGCFFIILLMCTIISSKYSTFSIDEQNLAVRSYSPYNNYIYTDRSDNALKSVKKIDSFVANLPETISNNLTNDWKIIIATDSISNINENDITKYTGVTLKSNKTITIDAGTDVDVIYNTFIHEFGHVFDMSYGFCSLSSEFQQIYEKYCESFKEKDEYTDEEYVVSNPQEFFATVCKEYFLYSEHLKTEAPDAYSYFDNIFNDVNDITFIKELQLNILAQYRVLKNDL